MEITLEFLFSYLVYRNTTTSKYLNNVFYEAALIIIFSALNYLVRGMFFFLDNIILGAFVFGGLYFSLVGCSVTSFLTHVILTNKGNYELDNSKDNESSYRRSWFRLSTQWCYIAYRSISDFNNH